MKFFKKNKFIIILLLSVFVLRIPSLFEPYWYGDEGIYLTIGMGIRRGLLLYKELFDNKPPVIYLITAITNGNQFWFKFLLTSSLLVSIYFFNKFAKIVFNDKSARISTIIFSILTTIRTFEGNIANAELFILMPTIISIYLLNKIFVNEEKNPPVLYFLSGILLSIGFLTKVPALFDFLSIFIFIVIFSKKKLNLFNRNVYSLILGYSLLILTTCLYFYLKGIFKEFFTSAFLQTAGYLTSWKTGTHVFSPINFIKGDMFIRFMITVLCVLIFWLKRRNNDRLFSFLLIWFIFSLFGATLSGRPYPHYLVEILLPTSLLIGYYVENKEKKKIIYGLLLSILLVFSFVRYHFWFYPTISYYKNFIDFSIGVKDKNQYFYYFGKNIPTLYRLAYQISKYSSENDSLFIWGNEPSLYPLSKRIPATPFTASYHIKDLNYYDQTIGYLNRNRPSSILVDNKESKFLLLENILNEKYIKISSVDNYDLYIIKNGKE